METTEKEWKYIVEVKDHNRDTTFGYPMGGTSFEEALSFYIGETKRLSETKNVDISLTAIHPVWVSSGSANDRKLKIVGEYKGMPIVEEE